MSEVTQGPAGQDGNITQPSAQPPASGPAPEGFVEKARLDGALRRIEELTLANRTLTDQLAATRGEKATLEANLGLKESEWAQQQTEFTTKLTEANTKQTELNSQLAKFQAMQLKMKYIGELNAPQLYSVIDVIPDTADEEALKASIQKLSGFAAQIAQKRESELVAGVTVIPQGPAATETLPTDDKGWQTYVNQFPYGSPEYTKAMAAWQKQLFNK